MTEQPYRQRLIPGGNWEDVCNRCGALVADRDVHDRFHDRLMLSEPNDGLDEHDIRMDVFTQGVNSPVQIRMTHLPTGVSVSNTGTGHVRTRQAARAMLASAVADHLATVAS